MSAHAQASARVAEGGHRMQRVLGLRDLVPMQMLIVIGASWIGTAARQGATQVSFWLLGALLFFLPIAGVVHYCVRIWPYEGGVYQWTKHAFGPYAGFLCAWNLGAWVLSVVSVIGVQTAAGLAYALGPEAAWMADSRPLIFGLDAVLFSGMLLVCIPGFAIGRWVSHFGTACTVLVALLLISLLFVHPHASAAHPHVSPQPAFSMAFPVLSLISLNLFSKIAFNGFTGLEQVAVFAGETRDAARAILRSAWVAAPLIALAYMLMTGAVLSYVPAAQVDLVNPVAQLIATAFGTGAAGASASAAEGAGVLLPRLAILAGIVAQLAQSMVYIAETSRLPMVAAWDHLLPPWFTRLHPRFGTPTRSMAVIVAAAFLFSLLASWDAAAGEAFQLLSTSGFLCYGVYYLVMFAVPVLVGTRFSRRPDLRAPLLLRLACLAGAGVTLLSMALNLVPIVDVAQPWTFALKVGLSAVLINLIGGLIYWRGSRRAALSRGDALPPRR